MRWHIDRIMSHSISHKRYFKVILSISLLTICIQWTKKDNILQYNHCWNSFVLDRDARYLYIFTHKYISWEAYLRMKVFYTQSHSFSHVYDIQKMLFYIKLFRIHSDSLMVEFEMPNKKRENTLRRKIE